MSCPRAKKERSQAKDMRQSPAPDRPSTGKKRCKVAKPYVVEQKLIRADWPFLLQIFEKGWHKYKAYAKLEDAEAVIKKLSATCNLFEYRIQE